MDAGADLVCLSHLRWDFVYQRPNHLMHRAAGGRRTFFFEEPILQGEQAHLKVHQAAPNLLAVTPYLPEDTPADSIRPLQQELLDSLLQAYGIHRFILWYYTPVALAFSRHLQPLVTVYDCMDELSAFRGAPPELGALERELFSRADVVFTGGHSLYEAKRAQHPNVHPFPSSVDHPHFAQARDSLQEPADQADLPRPRLGFFGVIDERMDLDLLAAVADARPGWQLVLVGPVVKIDPAALPLRGNIHYLGQRRYQELPAYLAGWDVALMPFALNESTRFISPTKTLEYLAAGKPVVSTAVHDVVHPYGELGLVRIADRDTFVAAIEAALTEDPTARRAAADVVLAQTSWDKTWARMGALIESAGSKGRPAQTNDLTSVTREESPCSTI